MTDLINPRLQGVGSACAERLPVTWQPGRASEWSIRNRVEVLLGALQIASALVAAVVWLVGVALLVQGLVSWWAELEAYRVSTGVTTGWEFPGVLE